MDDWDSVSGQWDVADGELVQSDVATSAMRALVGQDDWTDYNIKCKIMITQGSYTGVAFRAVSDLEYYVFYMNANENMVELWQHTGPGDTDRVQVFKHVPQGGVTIVADEWLEVEVNVEDTSAQFYVNGELQDEVDSLTLENGKVGAWAWTTAVNFDDFEISGPGIPEAPVEPAGKLPMTWGQIKE